MTEEKQKITDEELRKTDDTDLSPRLLRSTGDEDETEEDEFDYEEATDEAKKWANALIDRNG